MLSIATPEAFERLRVREFGRLDDHGIAYLDFTGSALYGASQVTTHSNRLLKGVFGNPHSEHGPSKASEADLESARSATLAFFDADPDAYDVCFTANASMAIKLVAESYPFNRRTGLVLSADNHNSMNGIREYARAADAPICMLPLDDELRLQNPGEILTAFSSSYGRGLFGFPAQSNFSGVKHPLELIAEAQWLGYDVLLDAAGVGCGAHISLRRHPVDFLALSYYKIFGLPTGVGALVAKRSALAKLKRPWFAGGTVDFVSVEHDRHRLHAGHAGFEDGTPNFLNLGSIANGFEFLSQVDRIALSARLKRMTKGFIERAKEFRRRGAPLIRFYGPTSTSARGATVAFNILGADGSTVPYQLVEARAREMGVALRGGCFCNPGAAERAFDFHRFDMAGSLDELSEGFTPSRLRTHLGPHATVGAVRLSLGLPTIQKDIDRALDVIESFLPASLPHPLATSLPSGLVPKSY